MDVERLTMRSTAFHGRWTVFITIYAAYMLFYMNKKNYTFFVPALLEKTGASKTGIGMMASAMEMTGAVTSLFNGVIVDTMSAKNILAGMLAVAALSNLALCFTDSVSVMVVLWGVNGFAQAFGWPTLARIFMNWFPDPAQRGKLYSLLSTNQNVGSVMVPVVLLPAMRYCETHTAPNLEALGLPQGFTDHLYSWRVAMMLPAFLGMVYAVVVLVAIDNVPADSVSSTARNATSPYVALDTTGDTKHQAAGRLNNSNPLSAALGSMVVWQLAICYFAIGLVRSFFGDWGAVFITEKYGGTSTTQSEIDSIITQAISSMEIGGLVGTLLAGWLSDKLFEGRRCPVIAALTIMIGPVIAMMLYAPPEFVRMVPNLTFFMFGCCFTAPHVLIGLAARELVPAHASSTAGGLVSAVSKIGSSVAGAPVGRLAEVYGWNGALACLGACSLAGGLLVMPLWYAKPVATATEDKKEKQI